MNIITAPDNITPCNICGSTKHHKVTHKRNYNIHKCENCHLYFVCPQPDRNTIQSLYDTALGYFATADKDLSKTSPSKAIKLDNILTKYLPRRGKFLDIGCSSGKLIFHMRTLGWEVYGNDLNKGALTIAKQHNLNTTLGTLEDCNFEESTFDAIHLGDLIEHVPSPKEIINIIEKILKPGGIITIVTPNSESGFARFSMFTSRLTDTAWPHSEAPHHLYDFNPGSIKKLLSLTGITVDNILYKKGGGFAYMIGNTGYFDSLKKSLKSEGKYKLNWRIAPKLPLLIVVSAYLLPIWWLGKLSDKLQDSGKSMLVIGKRNSKIQ